MTIQQTSSNEGKSRQRSERSSTSEQEGMTTSETVRSFLNADEVACLGSKVSIVFLKGERPLLLQRPTYYTHKRWKGQFDINRLETR